jgi:hypothetical protein
VSCRTRAKGPFWRLARPRNRHYTFARRRRCPSVANPAYRSVNVLICRLFCSLRLSVRTPPFHGGESGSIPLGSASRLPVTLMFLLFDSFPQTLGTGLGKSVLSMVVQLFDGPPPAPLPIAFYDVVVGLL